MAQSNHYTFGSPPDRISAGDQVLADEYFKYHSPYTHKPPKNKYNIVGDSVEECREIVVHEFTMGDVEDPDLYAGQPLYEWQQSEFGQWCMEHAADTPTWHRYADPISYGYKYTITAKFMGPALTEMLLRKSK